MNDFKKVLYDYPECKREIENTLSSKVGSTDPAEILAIILEIILTKLCYESNMLKKRIIDKSKTSEIEAIYHKISTINGNTLKNYINRFAFPSNSISDNGNNQRFFLLADSKMNFEFDTLARENKKVMNDKIRKVMGFIWTGVRNETTPDNYAEFLEDASFIPNNKFLLLSYKSYNNSEADTFTRKERMYINCVFSFYDSKNPKFSNSQDSNKYNNSKTYDQLSENCYLCISKDHTINNTVVLNSDNIIEGESGLNIVKRNDRLNCLLVQTTHGDLSFDHYTCTIQ